MHHAALPTVPRTRAKVSFRICTCHSYLSPLHCHWGLLHTFFVSSSLVLRFSFADPLSLNSGSRSRRAKDKESQRGRGMAPPPAQPNQGTLGKLTGEERSGTNLALVEGRVAISRWIQRSRKPEKDWWLVVYSWHFWGLHNWEGDFLITVPDICDLTKALSWAEGDSIPTIFSRHLLAQAPVKQHFTRSLWLSYSKSHLPVPAEHLPSPLLPPLVLSTVLQLGRTAEVRGTQGHISPTWQAPASGGPQLFLMHIQETLGRPRSSEWCARLYLWQAAGHNLPSSLPVCFLTFPCFSSITHHLI